MCSKCPGLNCVYVEYKRVGQRQKYMTAEEKKKHIAYGLIGSCVAARSNKVKGEKSAVVQRIVLS